MKGAWKVWVQQAFGRFGLQVRRLNQGVNLDDPFTEQVRLADPKAKIIFEVGAADGRDSEAYSSQFPNCKLFAFEPLPSSYQKIEKIAKTHPTVYPINEALADKVGKAKFHVANWHDASSLLVPKRTGSTIDEYTASSNCIEVSVNTIDNFCTVNRISSIDILKMDAQGAELKILRGASHLLKNRAIRMIYTEVSFMEIYEGSATFAEIMSCLLANGFRFHNLYGLNHNQRGELVQADAIFVLT